MALTRKKNNHLAEGEVTGHYHEAVGNGVGVFEHSNDVLLLDAPDGCEVTHQEHGTVVLPAGKFKSGVAQEFDPAEEEARNVRD